MRTVLCVSCPIDFKDLVEKSSKKLGLNQNDLVIRSVLFYLSNDRTPNEQINLTITQPVKKDKKPKAASCEIGQCKQKAVSKGTFKGKEYLLCSDHSNKLASVEGWKT